MATCQQKKLLLLLKNKISRGTCFLLVRIFTLLGFFLMMKKAR